MCNDRDAGGTYLFAIFCGLAPVSNHEIDQNIILVDLETVEMINIWSQEVQSVHWQKKRKKKKVLPTLYISSKFTSEVNGR